MVLYIQENISGLWTRHINTTKLEVTLITLQIVQSDRNEKKKDEENV